MSEDADTTKSPELTKEERLAAKLRENLRRRKTQTREQRATQADDSAQSGLPKDNSQS